MKWNSFLFFLFLLIFGSSSIQAKTKWVKIKTKQGCYLWWDGSPSGVLKTVTWTGKCKSGYASGKGYAVYKMSNSRHDTYKGYLRRGKLHGYGHYKWANKSLYIGNWQHGKREGKGTLTWTNGKRYIGHWKNGKKDGQGTLISVSGKRYIGHWKNDKKDGQGTLISVTGKRYSGTWKNNKIYGKGTYTLANGKKRKDKTAKKKDNSLQDIISTYLDLTSGYEVNRHLYYGN